MKLILGLTGTLAAGKGSVAEIIMQNDFDHVILSSIIKEEAVNKNIEFTRANLQKLGNELREKFGNQVLAQKAVEKFQDSEKNLIIDGIRNSGEIDFLKKYAKESHSKFYLICVDASIDLRYERTINRKSSKDFLSKEEFIEKNAIDLGLNQPSNGQRVQDCIDRADIVIMNDSSYEELKKKVNEILKKIVIYF